MCSLDIFAVIIILLLVLIIMAKERQKETKEFLIRDFRPHAYLIYSSDPAKCADCGDLADRFLLSIGRRDRYIAHMWNVENPRARDALNKFVQERHYPVTKFPTLIVERDGILEKTEGTELVRITIKDMI
jgi:predicted GTPase